MSRKVIIGVAALLAAGLFREVLICQAGDIATVNIAIECGRADRPLTLPLLSIDNDIHRKTLLDEPGNFGGVCMMIAQLDI